jgi:NADP-dependent 3-hydroxy acid dehydrogenase YdfG
MVLMANNSQPVAVVTGASSGIGAATASRLAKEGYHVVLAARRLQRLQGLASDIGGTPIQCDVTAADDVAALSDAVAGLGRPVHVLVNNAGGALGLDPVETSPVEDWQRMYESNVIGALRVTQALLPQLESSGRGTIVMLTSTAGHATYPGGGGYVAAKAAETRLTETLRIELNGRPVRVIEVAPGMVRTDEFSLVRFGDDAERAAKVYQGVEEPLVAEDVADCIAWCVTRPYHVNIDRLVVRPLAQASNTVVHRGPIRPHAAD